jgi:hypothetical protein
MQLTDWGNCLNLGYSTQLDITMMMMISFKPVCDIGITGSRDSSVSIETVSYGLDERGSSPGRGNGGIFSYRHRI